MEHAEAVIDVTDLRKTYRSGWFGQSVNALGGVTLQVRRGEIFGLLGPNGAGKTTIIKVVLGIVHSSGGSASLLGFPAGDRRGRKRVGYLPENLTVGAHQTARTAIEYYGRLSGLSHAEIRGKRDRLLQMVGLMGRERESVKQYSKGMRQRLGLAQALLHEPEVLILDEPTDGLDPIGRSQVRSILQELRDQGRTIFLNSHLLQEVELVCDRVAILDHGQLRFAGTIDDLTPHEESELQLELLGAEAVIRGCIGSRPISSFRKSEENRVVVELPNKNQDEADEIVDALRSGGVSIIAMAKRRKTLEDAFLEVVAQTAEVV